MRLPPFVQLRQDVGHDHFGAFLDVGRCDAFAEAAAGARDDGNFVFQLGHACLLKGV